MNQGQVILLIFTIAGLIEVVAKLSVLLGGISIGRGPAVVQGMWECHFCGNTYAGRPALCSGCQSARFSWL